MNHFRKIISRYKDKAFFFLRKTNNSNINVPFEKIDENLSLNNKVNHDQYYYTSRVNDPKIRDQNTRQEEEIIRNTNISMLKREIFNDTIQLSLKYWAYKNSPVQSAPVFLAELVRSTIDCCNHFSLLSVNYLSLKPSSQYPYGMDKVKNAIVLIPAGLFFYFGFQTILESIGDMIWPNTLISATTETFSYSPLICYAISLGVEIRIVLRNFFDATDLASGGAKLTFRQRLEKLLLKKDPLTQAILYENLITLISTSIPLIFSGISYLQPIPYLENVGSLLIGFIELYLAIHLAKDNFPDLIGKGIEPEIKEGIIQIIMENPYVQDIKDIKAISLGPQKFKFKTEITFKLNKIGKNLLTSYKESIDVILYSPDLKERREEVNDLCGSLLGRIMKEVQKQCNLIEEAIMKKYPECQHIDLEINHNHLMSYVSEEEKIKNYVTMDEDHLKNIDENWVKEAVDKILGKDYEKRILEESKMNLKNDKLSKGDNINYNMDLDFDYITEKTKVDEDIQFEIIRNIIRENEKNL